MARKKSEAAPVSAVDTAEDAIEGFAEDLSRLLGNARTKAEGWLGQRTTIGEHLTGIRDTATSLLSQLGIAEPPRGGRRRARSAAAVGTGSSRKRRTMSPEARARIGEAQRRRWAKLKREARQTS